LLLASLNSEYFLLDFLRGFSEGTDILLEEEKLDLLLLSEEWREYCELELGLFELIEWLIILLKL